VYAVSSNLQLKIFFLLPALFLFFSPLFASDAATVEAPRVKRVLILHSFGRDFAPYNAVSSSFRTELARQSKVPIEFFEASLETARATEGESEKPFVKYLRALFADRRLDLVVPFGAPAVHFSQRYRERLFHDVPMLLAAVDQRHLNGVTLSAKATAVAVRLDLPGIVENILRLLPGTANIAVVIGNSPLEKFWLTELRQELQPFTNRVQFIWLNELSFEGMRKRVAALPPNSAIFYALLLVDAAGVPYEHERALEILHSEAIAPIFGVFDSQLGGGIVGGPLYPTQEVSRESVRLALGILDGESPSSMQPLSLGPGTPLYDARELKRWKISESQLPAGSIVRFKQPTLWDQYEAYVIGAVVIILLQAALLTDLLLHRARRRRAEVNLRESEENLRRLVEGTTAVPWQTDVNTWVFTYVGPQAVNLLGYSVEEWYQKDFWASHLHPDDKEFAINTCLTNSRSTEDFEFEYRMIAASGKSVWVHDIVHCEHRNAMPAQLRGFMLDITERKQAEESLRESEERMSMAASAANLGLWTWDVARDQVWVTPEGRKFFGWDEVVTINLRRFLETLHPDDRELTRQAISRSLENGDDYSVEYRARSPDGTMRWIAARGQVEFDASRKPLRMLGIAIDITERKRGEEALREREERFRTMANTTPMMIWMSGTDKLCTFFNNSWLDFTGRPLEQELGNGWTEGVHPDDLDQCLEIYVSSFDARQKFAMEYRLRRQDDEYRWVLDNGVPRFEPDGTFLGYIGSCIDITERKRGLEELEKQRSFLRQVIDTDPNFIFAKDREGRFTLANQAVADAYSTTVENLIGKTDADFNPNREQVEFFRHMDTEVMDKLEERFIPEERITDAHGKTRWLQTVKRPIIEKDGSANQILGASTDITQRKQTESELRQQREELAHVTRISTMGELGASLAHELNQPLTAILSNAQAAQRFLASDPTDLEEVREILKDIVQDNSRAGEVIRRMRALVKKEELELAPLKITTVIDEVVRLVHSDAILRSISVKIECQDELPSVRGDKVQLQQVVLNLLLNAFDSMKEAVARERNVKVRAQTNGAGTVEISVRDHGTGLTTENLAKIFQPFYTTKREGLGMGLPISRSIVEAHGGRLWAESNADRGATFYFTVPAIDREASRARTVNS
jgi:PAS domain S-box-containing protein